MQHHQQALLLMRVARLALLRGRVARAAATSSSCSLPSPLSLPRALAYSSSATEPAASPSSTPKQQQQQQYREYEFALTPEHRRVTVVARNRDAAVRVLTSSDPAKIVVRAPDSGEEKETRWHVSLGTHGPVARQEEQQQKQRQQHPPPLPPLELLIPPRFCGLDITSAGGNVTVEGSGVQEADVRIVVVDSDDSNNSTPTIAATRLRCGELVLDAGAQGAVRAKELAASTVRVRGLGAGEVVLGRVSALDAEIEARGGLEVAALYGRGRAALRLHGSAGGGGASSSPSPPLPLLRVTQLSVEVAEEEDDDDNNNSGATLEAVPGTGAIAVSIDGGAAGAVRVRSGGGPVALALQAGDFRRAQVDSAGGDVDVSLDVGGGGGGGGSRRDVGGGGSNSSSSNSASVRVVNAGGVSIDPALGLTVDSKLPVSSGAGGGELVIDAGGSGRVALRARSWLEAVIARAGGGKGGGGTGGRIARQ
jgi:hypothetical protein